MNSIKTISTLSLFLFILITTTTSTSSIKPDINVWPKPVNISWTNPTTTTLSPSFKILSSCTDKHLRRAVRRYNHLILTELHDFIRPQPKTLSSSFLNELLITISDVSAPLQHGVDESYTLWIGSSGQANLTAVTVWGAMHGMETFSQLVWGTDQLMVPAGIFISDKPLFAHRGFMLDTSRNYFPVRDILRTIRAMSANKMNVFHWHITDSHSFPVELPSEPELAGKGSYGAKMRYSVDDIKMIVEYGMQHGVRVVPEIDTPAHTGSWAKAYPEIVACADMFWMPAGKTWPERLAAEPGTGQLNPLNPKTYEVIQNIINDMVTLFPDSFYHAGADEVVPACWLADPTISSFVSNNGTLSQLLELFINLTYPSIISHNRTVVYWEDVLLDPTISISSSLLPKETTILQTWNNGPNNTKRIVSAGYRVIVSSADFYYLDCGRGSFLGNDSRYDKQIKEEEGKEKFNYEGGSGGSWCGPYKTWQRVYAYDITHGLTEEEKGLVMGGEVALWTEMVDGEGLDGVVWMRAAAMAEALWSGNRNEEGRRRNGEVVDRLMEWRYRMVGRGIRAEALQPLWCLSNPGMCNFVQ
ncbi:hypothetical protein J5N97_001568 [Dioscorea zingiberensis]|uniref:Beta-hexosaminidase n=1 Tax=Dioscorea zingiberensis TaxID=325984 RepID=A0A9D5BU45_9LILI|nr:hypothetical protein J5N97_001568 [Dioscorea zingiberensis]